MNILGISAGFHDAAATIINPKGEILFAGHSERYSKIKHDLNLSQGLIDDVMEYGVRRIAYYERPWMKQLRRLRTGEGIDWSQITARQTVNKILPRSDEFKNIPIDVHNHHLCHAAAGFQTSPFTEATVVVIDAIGEFDTISIWSASYDKYGCAQYKRLWRQVYPHSIGLMYSAFTKQAGLRPMDEEYILMGMSGWGDNDGVSALELNHAIIDSDIDIKLKHNFHIGVPNSVRYPADTMDMAWAVQNVTENLISDVMFKAKRLSKTSNLVYMGGVALNCLANKMLGEYFDNIWIMPNPGDAGSSLGSAALSYGKQVQWTNAYLGHNIPGAYPVNDIISELLTNKIVGVASGRAEFGPRALGHRSLLADPRGNEIKDQVNEIKRRQKFRPFAPAILAEHVHEFFDVPSGFCDTSYMQVVARCKRPDLFPAIVHVDGTSRIQTVAQDGSGFRELLEKWYVMTDCPMLLNTSLNIRGEPMVNDRADADRFEQLYGVKVCS